MYFVSLKLKIYLLSIFTDLMSRQKNFTQSLCSSPIGSMDSIIVVENESGDRQDFTTIQVCIDYIYLA